MELLYIAFGSLLGIAVTSITDFIRDKRKARKFQKVVFLELRDLQIRLSFNHYLIGTKRGKYSLKDIRWVYGIVSEYDGPILDSSFKEQLSILQETEEKTFNKECKKLIRPEEIRSEFKKLYLPTLSSGLNDLAYIKPETARSLVDVLNQLNQLNETIIRHNTYFDKTFESGLTTENYDILSDNLTKAENSLFNSFKFIVEKIDKILNSS